MTVFIARDLIYAYDKPDPSVLCTHGRTRDCTVRAHGAEIGWSSEDSYVTVSYDDGLATAAVKLRGDERPPAGAHIVIERWNGRIVSIVDRATDRRYRTSKWPRGGRSLAGGLGLILFASIFTCMGGAVLWSVGAAVRTSRSRARSARAVTRWP